MAHAAVGDFGAAQAEQRKAIERAEETRLDDEVIEFMRLNLGRYQSEDIAVAPWAAPESYR